MSSNDSNFPETFLESFHDEVSCKKISYKTLGNTKMNVSNLGLGCSAFGGVYGKIDEAECQTLIEYSLKKGINYIDTAPWYGNSEEVVGRALKSKNIPRECYYIATKVGRYSIGNEDIRKMFDFSADMVEKSIDHSLKCLGVDYIDLAQVHDIEFAPSLHMILQETLPALQKLKDAGKIRFIGVTGFPLRVLKEVLELSRVEIDVVLSYCHYSLNDTSLVDYIPFFKSKGLGIINASPNSMGLLSCDGPQDWHPADQVVKKSCREALQYATEQKVDLAKLALEFSCSLADIHTTLVSTSRLDYMKANIDVVINGLDSNERNVRNEIREKFFIPLNNQNWEGIEVAEYRKQLSQANSQECKKQE